MERKKRIGLLPFLPRPAPGLPTWGDFARSTLARPAGSRRLAHRSLIPVSNRQETLAQNGEASLKRLRLAENSSSPERPSSASPPGRSVVP
jgi:hypothetical protein